MSDDPKDKRRAPRAPPPAPPAEGGENERPTVSPPFDVEAFAREATAHSGAASRRFSADALAPHDENGRYAGRALERATA